MKEFKTVVGIWLWIGVIMILFQVVIGGITRLTGSGLSITKWEIVTGTLPPLNGESWQHEFQLYKETPQYQKINEGMSMSEFKFIYYLEWFHRLWARMLGFVFLFPFLYFLYRGFLSKQLIRNLGVVILLAILVASFGWIMVASGLVDRPWVNAYKLSGHLSLAVILYATLLWITMNYWWNGIRASDSHSDEKYLQAKSTRTEQIKPNKSVIHNGVLKKWIYSIIAVLFLQIIVGGVMSGMKAGVYFPTFPKIGEEWIPSILFQMENWNVESFVNYELYLLAPGLTQVIHRGLAYLLTIMILMYLFKILRSSSTRMLKNSVKLLTVMLVVQFVLGVYTVINCKGTVPVTLGVLHQLGAILLFSVALYNAFLIKSFPPQIFVGNSVDKS